MRLSAASCGNTCFGVKTCDNILEDEVGQLKPRYKTCVELENVAQCDCKGCKCNAFETTTISTTPTKMCKTQCFGSKTCDEVLNAETRLSRPRYKTCVKLETDFGCDCQGCYCNAFTTTPFITKKTTPSTTTQKKAGWSGMAWVGAIWHSFMFVASTCLLFQNWSDRTKYPEGHLCLYLWSYWTAGVVCGTLSIYSIHLANKPGKTPSEYAFGNSSAVASLIVAGVMLFGWPLVMYVTSMIQCYVCGTRGDQLVLVSAQSSRRLKFANLEQMRSGNEFYLSLRSHGGASIVPVPPRCIGREMGTHLMVAGEFRYVHLGLTVDPNATQVKAKYDGKYVVFLVHDKEVALDISHGKMFKGNHVNAVRHHSRGAKQDCPARRWTLNNDGSLSPTDARHLALGDLCFSKLDPNAVIVATAVSMTEITDADESGDGAKSIPIAEAYTVAPVL